MEEEEENTGTHDLLIGVCSTAATAAKELTLDRKKISRIDRVQSHAKKQNETLHIVRYTA